MCSKEHHTTELGCILEIAGHYQRKDHPRYMKALRDLKTAIVADCPVAHVIQTNQGEEPTRVPDFGHNYLCQCKNPEPYGVVRYFGITLIVTGDPGLNAFGVYQINPDARLTVTIIGESPEHGTKELPQLARVRIES
jgi:hypothetical protein